MRAGCESYIFLLYESDSYPPLIVFKVTPICGRNTKHQCLVTLSSCDTGAGRLLGQEGIASLERAFLLAGAKSVLASLWTADDIFTTALMKRFYQYLVDGQDEGTALRQAKLDLLERFGDDALPTYWAGFVLVGDGATWKVA